ncbi:UBA domain-containing protein, partial [Dysosmobacter welbionis]
SGGLPPEDPAAEADHSPGAGRAGRLYRASRKMPSTSQRRTCPPDLRLRGHYGYPAVM